MDPYKEVAISMIAEYEGLRSNGLDTEDRLLSAARRNKNRFFDCPAIHSGLATELAAKNHIAGKRDLNTHDHWRGRTYSSKKFMNHWKSGRFGWHNIDRAAKWVKAHCRVHTVTKDQNSKLRKYQNGENDHFHYKLMYPMIGVDSLIPLPDMRIENAKKKAEKQIYFIHGVEYNQLEAVEKYNITTVELKKRCKAKRKYPEWQKKENQ